MYVYMYVCMYCLDGLDVCMYVCMYVCMGMYVHVYICVYIPFFDLSVLFACFVLCYAVGIENQC